MAFPKFLTVVSLSRNKTIKMNETSSFTEEIFDSSYDLLIEVLSQSLGFSYETVTPGDAEFGSRLPDGNWTGMVGMLQRGEADIIYKLAITEERSSVIDFSYPYYIGRMVFATKKLETSVRESAFLKPFTSAVWISLLTCIFFLPIIYCFLFKKNFRFLIELQLFSRPANSLSAAEYIFRTFWKIGEIFLRWWFTAVLLSFLTLPDLTGVRTVPELAAAVQEGRYQCSTRPGSFATTHLIQNGGYSAIIGENLKKGQQSENVERILSDTESSLRQAFIAPESFLHRLKLSYFVTDDSFFPVLFAIGLKKSFCCKAKLDSRIRWIWASGIHLKLLQNDRYKSMYRMFLKLPRQDYSKEKPLTLQDFEGIFIFLVASYIFATVVFILEILIKKCEIRKTMSQ